MARFLSVHIPSHRRTTLRTQKPLLESNSIFCSICEQDNYWRESSSLDWKILLFDPRKVYRALSKTNCRILFPPVCKFPVLRLDLTHVHCSTSSLPAMRHIVVLNSEKVQNFSGKRTQKNLNSGDAKTFERTWTAYQKKHLNLSTSTSTHQDNKPSPLPCHHRQSSSKLTNTVHDHPANVKIHGMWYRLYWCACLSIVLLVCK